MPNLQEETKRSFPLKIIEVFDDGFWAVSPVDKSLIKYKSLIRDKIILKNHNFKKNDLVRITLELAEKKGKDVNSLNKIIFYIGTFYIMASNGIYTKTFVEGEDPHKTKLWYESRGMITAKQLENNPFEVGDLIKVTIRKI